MPVIAGVIVCILLYLWWDWRRDYRSFQRMYRVKLPFRCVVTLTRKEDQILYGAKRYMHVRQDGTRDNRYAWNFKITYPTVIIINHFHIKIWNLKRANEVFLQVEEYMHLSLDKTPFRVIEGDPVKFFRGSQILFERYCGKLLSFYGWKCVLCYTDGCQLMATYDKNLYSIRCILRRDPVVLNDLVKLGRLETGTRWIVITNSKFSNGAYEYAMKNKILMMDGECMRRTLVYEEAKFL